MSASADQMTWRCEDCDELLNDLMWSLEEGRPETVSCAHCLGLAHEVSE